MLDNEGLGIAFPRVYALILLCVPFQVRRIRYSNDHLQRFAQVRELLYVFFGFMHPLLSDSIFKVVKMEHVLFSVSNRCRFAIMLRNNMATTR